MYNQYNLKPWQMPTFYYNQPNLQTGIVNANEIQQPQYNKSSMYYIANVPIGLAKSLEGKYYVGLADNLAFGNATHTWARLYNPPDSGVNLFVNVWTTTDIHSTPFRVQIYFNSFATGIVQQSYNVTPANTAFEPLQKPRVRLEYAVGVTSFPQGGTLGFVRNGEAGTTIVSDEEGKFIFPPGGNFLIFISNPINPTIPAIGKAAFGWWEEPIIS